MKNRGRPAPENIFDFVQKWRGVMRDRNRPAGPLSPEEIFHYGKAIRGLSRGLTRERELAGSNYFSDEDSLEAYLLYYFPISYVQACNVFDRLPLEGPARPRRALDLGSGPGALALALLDRGVGEVQAWDKSRAALALARRLAEARGHHLATRVHDLAAGLPSGGPGSFDLISLGHVLNELWPNDPGRLPRRIELLERLRGLLAERGRIMLIEPALPATAREALLLRDGMVERGWRVAGPCLFAGACPALPDGTCHVEAAWDPPPPLRRLAHAARLGRETLKFTWFVLEPGRGPLPPDPRAALFPARIVSEAMRAKSGRVRYLVCGAAGRFALSASEALAAGREFRALRKGDIIRVSAVEQRESGWGLRPESRIELLVTDRPELPEPSRRSRKAR